MRSALLVLNGYTVQKGYCDSIVERLWSQALTCVAVDGGGKHIARLLDAKRLTQRVSCTICGDLDSVDEQSLQKLTETYGFKKVLLDDQNNTDFTKALRLTLEQNPELECAIAVGGLYGRFDHVLSVLSTLHKVHTQLRVIVLDRPSDNELYNVVFLLPPGKHIVHQTLTSCAELRLRSPCGLVPVAGAARVRASGLKWPIDDLTLEMSGLVSTCNEFVDDEPVIVDSDKPLLFICQALM